MTAKYKLVEQDLTKLLAAQLSYVSLEEAIDGLINSNLPQATFYSVSIFSKNNNEGSLYYKSINDNVNFSSSKKTKLEQLNKTPNTPSFFSEQSERNLKIFEFEGEILFSYLFRSFNSTKYPVGVMISGVFSGSKEVFDNNFSIIFESLAVSMVNLLKIQKYRQNPEGEKLNKSNSRNKTTFDKSFLNSVGDAVFVHDKSGKILEVNQQAILSLGYSRAELLSMRVKNIDMIVKSERNLSEMVVNKIVPGQPMIVEGRHLRKDGSNFPVEVSISVHESGNLIAIARETSKRTIVKKELEKTKKFLENVIGSSQSIIYVYDFRIKRLIKGAKYIEKFLGYEQGTLDTLEDLLAICHQDDLGDLKEYQKLMIDPSHNETIHFEDRVKDAAGNWRWIKNSLRVFERDDHGLPIYVVGTGSDITHYKNLQERLQKSQKKYKALVENAFDAILVFDRDYNLTYASLSAYALLKLKTGHSKDLRLEDFVYEDDLSLAYDAWKEAYKKKASPITISELRLKQHNGGLSWAKCTFNNLLNDPDVEGFVINFSDISREKKAASEVQKKEDYYRSLVENSYDGVVLYDVNGKFIFASDRSKKLLGYDDGDEIPPYAVDFVYKDDAAIPMKAWKELIKHPGESIDLDEYRLLCKDGTHIWIQNTLTNHLDDSNVAGIVSNFRDITSRRRAEQNLHKMSNYNAFTGLPNRNFLISRLEQQIQTSRENKTQFGLIYIDIISLNSINTAHGHAIGDQVISKVAKVIQDIARSQDFVSKTGDDEFAIILPELSTYEISKNCQRLTDYFNEILNFSGVEVKAAIKAGVCVYPKDALNANDMLNHAEIALKRAKKDAEAFAFYKNRDSELARYRLNLERDLHAAIINDDLILNYQPIIDAKSGEVIFSEALLRWEHPTLGPVSPHEFVKLAEETNLIGDLSQWVIEASVAQIQQWNKQDLYPKITINLSPKDIRRKNMVTFIVQTLKKFKVAPESLVIELTESEEILDLEFSVSQMNELNQFGVSIILDDFGTGFSSISHLLNLPIAGSKIDKSFIRRKTGLAEKDTRKFLNGIINLVQGKGLVTIVEGVETVDQFQILQDKNDLLCQGFLFARPLTVEDITKVFKNKLIDIDNAVSKYNEDQLKGTANN